MKDLLDNLKIRLVKDTIDSDDISRLISWLETNPRLTKGNVTSKFEETWTKWQGRKYSVFVNSGSSANLAMLYALIISNKLRNKKIIVPAISWVTTVSPIMQLGLEPILCDTDVENLGVNVDHLEKLFKKEKPAVLIIVNVLGFPNKMKEIIELCNKYNVILLEDSCESVGSTYNGTKTGNFGLMSSFSTYFGHHFSTIEGGIISTDNEELYHILLSIRSHGWGRDLPEKEQKRLIKKYNISKFKSLYTFYYPGFNLRSTDLQAFIGLGQLEKLEQIIQKRHENFKYYNNLISNKIEWKIKNFKNCFISNFAYPIVTKNVEKLAKKLLENGIEVRPLICGSIGEQPFWIKKYGLKKLKYANYFNNNGMYLPNHHHLKKEEIELICNIVNQNL
jgi:CDP-6-deoxy-D-xylo-4-hexulose-3-dehydrase